MADYIARERAFHGGNLIERGAVVTIEDGQDVPEWCVQDASDVKQAPAVQADVRPAETQAAVKKKVQAASDAAA
jgi:hypothetical protein